MNPIKILRMGRGIITALTGATFDDNNISPTNSSSQLYFNNDGTLVWTSNASGSLTQAGQWLTGVSSAQAALYELEVVITSGTAYNTAGTTAAGSGTWRDLSVSRMYGNDKTSTGVKSTTATFTIRRKSDLVTMATASLIISATVSL